MSNYNQITIRPLCASLQHDTDLFGKMDPYCLVTLGTQQWKSEISKKGDKTPCWNDEVVFVVQQGVDLLRVALFDDKLIGQDKLIAEGVIPMDKLLNFASPFEEKIPLTYKAKPCGYIQLRFTFGTAPQMMNQGIVGQNFSTNQNTNYQQYPSTGVANQQQYTQQQQYAQQPQQYAQQLPQSQTTHHTLLHHEKTQQYAQNQTAQQQQFQGQQLTGQQLTSQSIPYQQQNVQVPLQQNQQSSQIPQSSSISQSSTTQANQIPPLQQQPGAVGSNDYYHHQHHHTFNKQ